MQLVNGNRVVIVGGGPAGSFSALHFLRFAAEAQLQLEIVLFEFRNFNRPGPGGCNKCAGILSSRLIKNLDVLNLNLPADVIQSELSSYVLHLGSTVMPLHHPDPTRRIYSVYRGSGPRLGSPPFPHSFDSWLLDQARERGAIIRNTRVQSIRRGARPIVVTAREQLEADLVVVATGVNNRIPLDPSWRYHPPRTEIMAQDEVPLPTGVLDSSVHIFFDRPAGLIFGGLIPKGRYANISLLGRNLPPDAVGDFIESHNLDSLAPEGTPFLCGCTPRIAISSAKNFFADRLVVVGDAAATRLYKDGIGSAFVTAEAAARTAIQRGVSRRDFAAGYAPLCWRITTDNLYGRLLFRLWGIARRLPPVLEAWRGAILAEADVPSQNHVHTRVLWGMFTGDESYRQMFWHAISRVAMLKLWQGFKKKWRER